MITFTVIILLIILIGVVVNVGAPPDQLTIEQQKFSVMLSPSKKRQYKREVLQDFPLGRYTLCPSNDGRSGVDRYFDVISVRPKKSQNGTYEIVGYDHKIQGNRKVVIGLDNLLYGLDGSRYEWHGLDKYWYKEVLDKEPTV